MVHRRACCQAGSPLLVAFLLLLCGCTHVTLVSAYDEATDRGVTAIQKSVEALLEQLDQPDVPAYAATKASYDAIRADLRSLRFRNEARPNNSLTVRQLDDLKAILDKLESLHKAGRLVQPMVGPSRDALAQALRAILKLELAKKELAQ